MGINGVQLAIIAGCLEGADSPHASTARSIRLKHLRHLNANNVVLGGLLIPYCRRQTSRASDRMLDTFARFSCGGSALYPPDVVRVNHDKSTPSAAGTSLWLFHEFSGVYAVIGLPRQAASTRSILARKPDWTGLSVEMYTGDADISTGFSTHTRGIWRLNSVTGASISIAPVQPAFAETWVQEWSAETDAAVMARIERERLGAYADANPGSMFPYLRPRQSAMVETVMSSYLGADLDRQERLGYLEEATARSMSW